MVRERERDRERENVPKCTLSVSTDSLHVIYQMKRYNIKWNTEQSLLLFFPFLFLTHRGRKQTHQKQVDKRKNEQKYEWVNENEWVGSKII